MKRDTRFYQNDLFLTSSQLTSIVRHIKYILFRSSSYFFIQILHNFLFHFFIVTIFFSIINLLSVVLILYYHGNITTHFSTTLSTFAR